MQQQDMWSKQRHFHIGNQKSRGSGFYNNLRRTLNTTLILMTSKPYLPKALLPNITTLQTIHSLKHRMSRDWRLPAPCAPPSCYPEKPWAGQLLLLPLQCWRPVLPLPQMTRTHLPFPTSPFLFCSPWTPADLLPSPATSLFTCPPFLPAQCMSQSVHRNASRHEYNHSFWHVLHS